VIAVADYEPSKAGWAKIAMSPELQAACLAEAKRGQEFAESISPRSGDGDGKPYAESFSVRPIVVDGFGNGPRVGAELANEAPHSAAVEFGNEQTPRPQRILGRTAAFLGSGT
jgi:hypothetical protein